MLNTVWNFIVLLIASRADVGILFWSEAVLNVIHAIEVANAYPYDAYAQFDWKSCHSCLPARKLIPIIHVHMIFHNWTLSLFTQVHCGTKGTGSVFIYCHDATFSYRPYCLLAVWINTVRTIFSQDHTNLTARCCTGTSPKLHSVYIFVTFWGKTITFNNCNQSNYKLPVSRRIFLSKRSNLIFIIFCQMVKTAPL